MEVENIIINSGYLDSRAYAERVDGKESQMGCIMEFH